ncbi:hypothetical protein LTR60_000922 [Cryomyces antarcticus]|nr:hypothetical protein LTR60_000922 [Cryomyces antarcticus]
MGPSLSKYAYTTLITRSSYLAGVIVLARTLRKHGSAYPLVVLYTESLPAASIRALELEVPHTNLVLKKIPALLPRKNVHVHLIAERFADTWTKLRVFELWGYDTVCYLDADMIVCKDSIDRIFDTRLPADDWIAANHACVCNLDKDTWAPADWTKENCAYTPTTHPAALAHPTPVTPDARPTYHLLNSGMFVFKPSQPLWERMLGFFNTTPLLGQFKFPDQDFLAEFFRNRWVSVGWQYNALKTMRYWHPNMWRDDEVVVLHYIVDKPWAKRVAEDGSAGYLGRDGVTHGWWWDEYAGWEGTRENEGDKELVETAKKYVARPSGEEGEESEESEEMRAIGSQVQAFANNKPKAQQDPNGDSAEPMGEEDIERDGAHQPQPDRPVLRKKMLGERGHGPVVHDRLGS